MATEPSYDIRRQEGSRATTGGGAAPVSVVFERSIDNVPLPTPEQLDFYVDDEMRLALTWATQIGRARGESLHVSFSSLFLAMALGPSPVSRWLAAFLEQRGVKQKQLIELEDEKERHEGMQRAVASRPTQPMSSSEVLHGTVSARQALQAASDFRDSWGSDVPIELRHLVAAFATIPHYHDSQFTKLRVGRRHWVRGLAAAQMVDHPEEAAIWRDYLAKGLLPEPALSPDVYTTEDLLDIDPEIDALGQLVTSTHTVTPLSLGIFGPWGSGKTFFMRHLRRRVATLATLARGRNKEWMAHRTAPLAPESFHLIAQVEFNAWHYNQGNVIASLVDQIFRNLVPDFSGIESKQRDEAITRELEDHRKALEAVLLQATQSEVAASQSAGAAKARETEAKSKLDQAVESEKSAIQRVEAARQGVADAQGSRDAIAARLTSAKAAIEGRKPGLEAIRTMVATELGKTPVVQAARAALDEADKTSQEATSLVALLTSWQGVLAILVILGSFVLTAFWGAIEGKLAALAATFGAVTLALRQAREVLATVRKNVSGAADRIDKAHRTAMRQHLAALKKQLEPLLDRADEALTAAATRMAEAEAEVVERAAARDRATVELSNAAAALSTAAQTQQASRDEIERTRAQLAATTAGWLLEHFLQDRLRTEDYKKELGFMALVRRDFERLNDLISSANAEFLAEKPPAAAGNGKAAPAQPALQRIVLYIDDLDRCNEKTVVEVLQAVHLLLAFPLFVCVVAVDPRWVGRCLQKHFPELLIEKSSEEKNGEAAAQPKQKPLLVPATVADYLEKIFQIPIWMSPVSPDKRADIVKALLSPHKPETATRRHGEASAGAAPAPEPGDQPSRPAAAVVPRKSRARSSQLLIAEDETKFVDQLGPILSDRPRILKRFVNTYRLLKASLPDEDFDGFVSAKPDSAHRICLVELALLLAASPHDAKLIVDAIHAGAKANQPIGAALGTVAGVPAPVLPKELTNVAASTFAGWTDRTSRYLFLR